MTEDERLRLLRSDAVWLLRMDRFQLERERRAEAEPDEDDTTEDVPEEDIPF